MHQETPVARGEGDAVPEAGFQVSSDGTHATCDLADRIAGLFVNDSFAEEVDAFIQASRQRERDEAAK